MDEEIYSLDFDFLEGIEDGVGLVGPENPLLCQSPTKIPSFSATPVQNPNQDLGMDMAKAIDGAGSTINTASGPVVLQDQEGLSSETGWNFEKFMQSDDPATAGRANLRSVNTGEEQLTTREGEWIDGSQAQLTLPQNNLPSVPDYGGLANSATEEEFVVTPATEVAGAEGIVNLTFAVMDSATGLPVATITSFPGTSTYEYDQSVDEMNSGPSSFGKCKSSRAKKKKFLHENPDKDNPVVKRAAGAKDYRERKKQEALQREQGLLQELEELKAKLSTLQQKLDANEAVSVSSDKTVKILDSIVCAVKAAGGGDVIVMPRLADKQAVTLTDDNIQQIVQAARLSNPGKRFKLVFDIDEQGKLIAQKID